MPQLMRRMLLLFLAKWIQSMDIAQHPKIVYHNNAEVEDKDKN
jgi:hypothetical protein